MAAVVTSLLFLISYLTYHYYHGDTNFPGQGMVRPFYFVDPDQSCNPGDSDRSSSRDHLLSRTRGTTSPVIDALLVDLPLWLYVSVTGVIVYLMLYHLYPS